MNLHRVEISKGFMVLWAWLLYRDETWVVPQMLLACSLHELGHILVLCQFRQPIQRIKLTVFGAQIFFENTLSYFQELIAALAGPGMNILVSYLCCTFPEANMFAGINLALALFNLLPVGHLDGGRCVNSLLYLLFPASLADKAYMVLSVILTGVLFAVGIAFGVFGANYTWLLMCGWIVQGYINENMANTGKN